MIFGDKNSFAIESELHSFASHESLRGLGFFVIYINGVIYGNRSDCATALACTHDEVAARLANRGFIGSMRYPPVTPEPLPNQSGN